MTLRQNKMLWAIANRKGFDKAYLHRLIGVHFSKNSLKLLTENEAKKLIGLMEYGCMPKLDEGHVEFATAKQIALIKRNMDVLSMSEEQKRARLMRHNSIRGLMNVAAMGNNELMRHLSRKEASNLITDMSYKISYRGGK